MDRRSVAWPDSGATPPTGGLIGPPLSSLVMRRAEVDGALVDVRVDDATVTAIGPPGSLGGADREIRCGGGALLPGLHDHHLHLMAMAAALSSVDASSGLDDAIGAAHGHARPGEWIRAVGYDEAESGSLDRWRLDELASGRPVRVQHRSGSMWVLNSAALERVGALESGEAGIERDRDGHPTGRLFRLDAWLHERLPDGGRPDLAAVGRRIASYGVTGVTDCTPATTLDHLHALAEAVNSGALPFTVAVTGGPELSETVPPGALRQGPVKIVIADHSLPELRTVAEQFRRAHRVARPVAVHCVTRAALVLALAAWHEAGSIPGDRIEHAAVTPLDLAAAIADLGIAVVTQPAFLAARGDMYLRDVELDDQADLYRCASLRDAGIDVGGSTDAPFGPDDPWIAMGAAVDRRSPLGARVGLDRGLEPTAALDLFLAPLNRPGGPVRQIRVGGPADLCLLDAPKGEVLSDPSCCHVAVTIASGVEAYSR